MKASANKRRRDTRYTSEMIVETSKTNVNHRRLSEVFAGRNKDRGNRKAIPVRTAEETRHSIASTVEGKLKNHPAQCIPPNTRPTTGIQKIYAISYPSFSVE